MKGTGLILFILLIVAVLFGVFSFNKIQTTENEVDAAWANVETAYQRRMDLIPNLVETVKGYAEFEKETLTGVVEARSKATQTTIDPTNLTPESIAQFDAAQQGLSGALSRLLLTVERYPDLKANQNFLNLQAQLEGTENRIKVARDRFNDSVKGYNNLVETIPSNIVASFMGKKSKGYFESQSGAEVAPKVEFGF